MITLLSQHTSVKDPKDDMTVNPGIRDFGSFAETRTSQPQFLRALNSGQLLHGHLIQICEYVGLTPMTSDGPQGNRDSEKITLLLQHQSVKDPKDDMTANHRIRDFGSFAETKTF